MRTRDALHARIGVASLPLGPGAHAAAVEFLADAGKLVTKHDVTITVAAEKPDTVVFISERTT